MRKYHFIFILFLSFSLVFQSCDWGTTQNNIDQAMGWFGDTENTSNIEDDVTFGTTFSSGNLPDEVDLTPYFPPIGDQGQYGTCVAWAVGYNHKSFLQAKLGDYTYYTSDNQMYSPKDLFWAISSSDKGSDCNGTSFEAAYDVLLNRGIAHLSVVPYTDLGDCSSSPQSSWTTDAANNKIYSYREIGLDVDVIKTYLADGKAVVFGAKLGDEFFDYSSGVLDYQSYGYSGDHAYHAMILSGYDDNMGANGAFRVVNSWGSNWGDNGGIWVDQNYFVTSDFGFCAFVATDTQVDPDQDDDNQVDDPTSGYDLIAWELNDIQYPGETDPRWRQAIYNVYNAGENTLSATDDWCIVYLLYNAYDGDDYQVVLFDYYSNDFGSYGNNGNIEDETYGSDITDNIPAQGYWWNYVDVLTGQSVSSAVFGNDDPFNWGYYMPNVTGDYYLVIFADGFDNYAEFDESNNYTYFTDDYGDPLHIVNGVIQNAPTKSYVAKTGVPVKGQNADIQTVRTQRNLNAYSTSEISAMLMRDVQNGNIQKKVFEYIQNSSKSKGSFSN
ncbi:MAG: C1 family peptidase [Bacteroidales bacterium]|nr:C1 family peptidase [Bacteroidales bacterium]